MQTFGRRNHAHHCDRRRHQRLAIGLAGKCLLANSHEQECETSNISLSGAFVKAKSVGRIGEKVIVYLERLGRLEGTITRCLREGFAMRLDAPAHKQEKLRGRLAYLEQSMAAAAREAGPTMADQEGRAAIAAAP